MKPKILLLSAVTSFLFTVTNADVLKQQLTLFTSSTNVSNQVNTKNHIKETKWLFNNEYGLLDNYNSDNQYNDWIVNKSSADNKFYCYNTSALANYGFKDARQAFIVDTNGNLVANPEVTIPETDEFDIANTRQEMITYRQVVTINNTANLYSKSEYQSTYFSNSWKYLQLGGLAPSINIKNQNGGDNIVNMTNGNENLNETLAFFYIAKAVKQYHSISFEVAKNLTHYFIDHSSVNDKASVKTIADVLIPLIVANNDIYNFIAKSPILLTDKNFSLNYILDSSNHLIAIYYLKWNNDNVINHLNFRYEDWFNGTKSQNIFNYHDDFLNFNYISTAPVHFSWKNYADDWETFITVYPEIKFDNSSLMVMGTYDYFYKETRGQNINIATNQIATSQKQFCPLDFNKYEGGFTATIFSHMWIFSWHDKENIYFNLGGHQECKNVPWGLHYLLQLNDCVLTNIMN